MISLSLRSSHSWLSWLSSISLSLLAPGLAHADFLVHFWENQKRPKGEFYLAPELSRITTSTNFDSAGLRTEVPNLIEYTRIQTDFLASYGVNERLSLFARAAWANVNVDHPQGGKSFGLTDQTLGATFRLFEKAGGQATGGGENFAIDLQAQADLPAYSNATAIAQALPFRGDGSIDLTGGAFIHLPFARSSAAYWSVTAGAGYTFRSGGFSSAVPWSATLRYTRLNEGLFAAASALGLYSLQTDMNDADRSTIGAGGSFMVNAVNPSHMTARAQVGYQVSPLLSVSLSGFQTLAGTNAPLVQSFLFGLQYRLHRAAHGDPRRMSGPEYGHSNQGLVTYSLDARVTKVNDRLNLVKIDKGSHQGVSVGQVFDLFSVKKNGAIIEAVARAKVTSTAHDEAVLTISEYYREVWIEEGFIAKRPVQ